jgi:hypothetical protein
MESVYYIVAIRVNKTSWAHVWRLRSRYLGTGYDIIGPPHSSSWLDLLGQADLALKLLSLCLGGD